MSDLTGEAQDRIAQANILPVFETVDELNALIADQNQRFLLAAEVFADEPELLQLTQSSIAEEQQETFTDLTSATEPSAEIYAAIGQLSLVSENEASEALTAIAQLEAESEEISQKFEALKKEREAAERYKYDELLQQVEKLAPKAIVKAKEMLDRRLESDIASEELKLVEDSFLQTLYEQEQQRELYDIAKTGADAMQALIDAGGVAWPVPQALINAYGGNTAQWIIDELPVEPKLNPSGHDRYIALRERYVDQPDASLYAAMYLMDHSSETVTVDDLASFLYSDEVVERISNHNLRARVTTVLGPIAGEALHKILDADGYVLQYGWRRLFEKNGGNQLKVKSRYRIYRAISLDDLDSLSTEGTEKVDNVVDEFEITPEINQLLSLRSSGLDAEPEDTEAINQADTSEKVPSWVKELRKEVGRELSTLEEVGLLADETGVPLKVARRVSPSRIAFTEATLDKLITAGFMRKLKGVNKNNWWSEVVTPTEMVLVSLFNTNQDLLGRNQPRRRRAANVISEAVDNYFEHKRESAED